MNEVDTYAKIIWDYMLMHHELRPVDAILVFGSSDVRVAEHAADLFKRGYGEYIIFAGNSGAKYGKTAHFDKPEAEIFATIARNAGVPIEKILIEDQSANSEQNVRFTKALLEEKGPDYQSFIVVQKPFMERRAYATFKKFWPEARCLMTSPNLSYEEYLDVTPEERDRYLNAMVGDLQRIKEYPAVGFMIQQEIPDEFWQAYEQMVALGYTKRLIKDTVQDTSEWSVK